jgi:pSer/pThr/pTyr-binding forkhead associated (FHA) protein
VAPATVAEPEVGPTSIILPAPVADPRPEPAPARPVPEPAPAVFRVGERPRPPQPDRAADVRARLVLDDGSELVIDDGAVIGRDPAPTSAVPGATLLAIDDPGHSLSKTHAALVVDRAGAWVIDLHSSNGTAVRVDACRVPCPSGERVAVPDGAVLELGARSATVHLEARR